MINRVSMENVRIHVAIRTVAEEMPYVGYQITEHCVSVLMDSKENQQLNVVHLNVKQTMIVIWTRNVSVDHARIHVWNQEFVE
jgi:hypothetical protein